MIKPQVTDAPQAGVGLNHPDYDRWLPRWQKMRLVTDGEQAVKDAGEAFLPCPPAFTASDDRARYEGFKARAEFVNAVAPSRDFMVARLFADAPSVALPDALIDADLGLDVPYLTRLAKQVTSELAETGRFGIAVDLVDDTDTGDTLPVLRGFPAEAIVNWRYTSLGARPQLSLVVLEMQVPANPADPFDHAAKPQRLVMALDAEGLYYTEVWEQLEGQWSLVKGSRSKPQNRKGRLAYIPFYIFGASAQSMDTNAASLEAPILEPLANAVLRAYETSAWLRNGLYLVGTPTAYIADDFAETPADYACQDCGQTTSADLFQGECGLCGSKACGQIDPDGTAKDPVLGSDTIYYLSAKGKLAFAEVSGAGFEQLGRELERGQEKILALGASSLRLAASALTKGSKTTATAEAINERTTQTSSQALGNAIDKGFEWVLKATADFMNVPAIEREQVLFRTYRESDTTQATKQDVEALVVAWKEAGLPVEGRT